MDHLEVGSNWIRHVLVLYSLLVPACTIRIRAILC
jgi:hypothetical protein